MLASLTRHEHLDRVTLFQWRLAAIGLTDEILIKRGRDGAVLVIEFAQQRAERCRRDVKRFAVDVDAHPGPPENRRLRARLARPCGRARGPAKSHAGKAR